MGIKLAIDTSDFKGIRKLWEERFTTDQSYLNTVFKEVFPFCRSYVYSLDGKIVSVASLMPMNFTYPDAEYIPKGFYLFGVATSPQHEGKKLAATLIGHAIRDITIEGYDFIFERPANQGLNNYYLKLGFSKSLPKLPYRFKLDNLNGSTENNHRHYRVKTTPESILEEIRIEFPKRFEWTDKRILEGLINLGEVEYNNEIFQNGWNRDETYIAIKTLSNISPEIFENSFFCFSME